MLLAKRLRKSHFPQHHADTDGDVEGVLGALLGNLQREVTGIYHGLLDAFYLVSEDQGVLCLPRRAGTPVFPRL